MAFTRRYTLLTFAIDRIKNVDILEEMVDILLNVGADPGVKIYGGGEDSPLMEACGKKSITNGGT